MNNDKQKMDLEGLLAEVEHAGRDARRRDELAVLVDTMAVENGEHGVWWWVGRVAAAACVLFFISTAVRIWFIPTGTAVDDNLVAQAYVPEVEMLEPSSSSPKIGEGDCREAVVEEYDTETPAPAVHEEIIETPVVEEEYVAEEVQVEPILEEQDTVITIEEVVAPEPAPMARAEPVEIVATPIVSVGNTPAAPAEERKPKRASILKTLLHRHEPSKMDGTMLVLNIL